MTYTENYALNQWAKTDRIQMSDFNADNAKIDAELKANADALASKAEASALTALQTQIAACGNCRIVTGTYKGNGKYGESNKNMLTFSGKPLFVAVSGVTQFYAAYQAERSHVVFVGGTGAAPCYLTWGTNSLSWYGTSSAEYQCNLSGNTYYYVALLLCE